MEGPIPYIHGPTPRIMPFWLPLRPTGCGACWVCDPRYHQISSDLVRSRQIYRNPIDFRSRVSRFHVFGVVTLRHVVQVEALVADGVLPFWTYSVYALATPLTVVHRRRVPGHGPNPGIQVSRTSNSGVPKHWILGIWTSRFDPSWVPTHGTPIRLSRMAPGPQSILDVYRICSLGGPLRYPPSGRILASSVLWSGTDLDLPKWVILGVRGPDFGVPNHLFL